MLHYRRAGAGNPLILIHGFLGGSGVWLGQQVGLHGAFDTVAVDLPGFAGSSLGSAPNTMQAFGTEIVKLADALGFQRFSLLGWSFGGMIAQQVALQAPDRIGSMVLAGTAAVGELPRRFETWSQTLERIASDGLPAVFDRTIRTWFVANEHDPFFPVCRAACEGATKEACAGAIQAMQPWSAADRLQEISTPTLIIVGDQDRSATPDDSFVLFTGLPKAQLCVLPRCAHGAHMEQPAIFNHIVARFLLERTT